MILNAENMQTSKYFWFWGKIAKQQEIFVVPLFFAILEHFNCGGSVIMIWYLSRCFYILCENFLKLTGRDYKKLSLLYSSVVLANVIIKVHFFVLLNLQKQLWKSKMSHHHEIHSMKWEIKRSNVVKICRL